MELETHENLNFHDVNVAQSAFYFRTAYRHEAQFVSNSINNLGDPFDDPRRPAKLIDTEARVSDNFQRIVGNIVSDVFSQDNDKQTLADVRERLIGRVRTSMGKIFGDLMLEGMGSPTQNGTFLFTKGISTGFEYINLSGGEKAAFDLILDLVVKTETFTNTAYFIDEPELHMNSRLQANLLEEMFAIMPPACQLWIATHSIGMMRKAMDLHENNSGEVVFLDFEGQDFDQPVVLEPQTPGRDLWKRVFSVALDDLSNLIAPNTVIFCEGKLHHEATPSKPTFDAEILNRIFDQEYPNTTFIPLGGTNDLDKNALMVGGIFEQLFKDITLGRLTDRDDRSDEDIRTANKNGFSILHERDIENYLWADEILEKLCKTSSFSEKTKLVLGKKNELLSALQSSNKPLDDVKSVTGLLYNFVKQELNLIQRGNNAEAFAKVTLAPLITPETDIYKKLKSEIFGPLN